MMTPELEKIMEHEIQKYINSPSRVDYNCDVGFKEGFSAAVRVMSEKVERLERENKLMREALEFYADKCNWSLDEITFDENRNPFWYIRTTIRGDDENCEDKDAYGGKRARQALASLKENT